MNISVFGLGYVGAVTAGCLAHRGHRVVGVDVHPKKVDAINEGVPPIIERGLGELLQEARARGLLCATPCCRDAIHATSISIVCVGTPSNIAGALDLSFVRHVCGQIATALGAKRQHHTIVLRSTMLPGSTRRLVDEFFADLVRDGAVDIVFYPEFLREGVAVKDFEHPSLAVVGTRDAVPPPPELMESLFCATAAVVNWETAELAKYACNAFHALKIAFANEIGRVGKQADVDARAVMDLLCQDTRLNVSALYLKPGNPFGGSCLPKDVRALMNHARVQGVNLPVLENLLLSNERHLQTLLALIERSGERETVILGLSFKPHTDDVRESAMVEVAQALVGRGYQVRIYDPALNLAALVGANKRVIDTKMPHLACLLKTDIRSAVGDRGLIIAAQPCASVADLKSCVTEAHQVLDVNGWPELRELPARYHGFCW